MILTVTLNAALDKTFRIEGFSLDRVHRPSEMRVAAGGKGINVARAMTAFGENAVATGFLGGYNGSYIAESLKTEGIESDFVQTREESRVCIAVVDPENGTQTEINEVGPEIAGAELSALKSRFRDLLGTGRFRCAVLSGSIPPGVSPTIYAELNLLARDVGVECALDASGEALKEGVKAVPWMVKPNIHELSYLAGRELRTRAEILEAIRTLVAIGIRLILVTCGREGALAYSDHGLLLATPPTVRFVSAVGSGDAFLAAYIWAVGCGRNAEDCLRVATAAGALNASRYGSCCIDADEVFELARDVRIEALN